MWRRGLPAGWPGRNREAFSEEFPDAVAYLSYNILCTAYHFVLIVLFDIIQAAKWLILPGRDRNIRDLLHHSRAAFRMLWQTRFGSTSIH